jgi:mono/diheme cytochrome c family protein
MKLKAIVVIGVLLIIIVASCQNDDQLEFSRYYSTGTKIYKSNCQNCHGVHGEGLGALIPPLTDSVYLKNNKTTLACAIQFGLKGKITIANKQFDGEMPANDIAPIEVAEVMTYIGNSFGNKLGTTTINQVNNTLVNCK